MENIKIPGTQPGFEKNIIITIRDHGFTMENFTEIRLAILEIPRIS